MHQRKYKKNVHFPLQDNVNKNTKNYQSIDNTMEVNIQINNVLDKYNYKKSICLPSWFLWLVTGCVSISIALLVLLILSQQKPSSSTTSIITTIHEAMQQYALITGVLNSILGSFMTASGYCCQKYAHTCVQFYPSLGSVTKQPSFCGGLLLLILGTISAIVNLGILGQAIQAPFAALTLIYSALLGRYVLHEIYSIVDFFSSVLIITGVCIDVYAGLSAHPVDKSYTIDELESLFFRDSIVPSFYLFISISYIIYVVSQILLNPLTERVNNIQKKASGLFAFSSCAGIMAGYTSLATKSAVEVAKAQAINASHSSHEKYFQMFENTQFILLILAIPCTVLPQLFFLNKGLECFGTLKFVPLYQTFIILGNMACGIVYYDELSDYSGRLLCWFIMGVCVTLCGVSLLLIKVKLMEDEPSWDRDMQLEFERVIDTIYERRERNAKYCNLQKELSSLPNLNNNNFSKVPLLTMQNYQNIAPLKTKFTIEAMQFANGDDGDVELLCDFQECQDMIVSLLDSAETSIYYSTFLCDFYHPLQSAAKSNFSHSQSKTIASCLEAAAARGVKIWILYNPIGDYGTASMAELKLNLPSGVFLTTVVSDLGPSRCTRWASKNSKYAFHHQKYLCVDNKRIMVTGCDVNRERNGWLQKNAFGYYWHEVSVVLSLHPSDPTSGEIKRYVESLHHHVMSTSGKIPLYDDALDKIKAPFPLVSGGLVEENAMVNLIQHAKESIHLENQILISGGSELQQNRIVDAIVRRIARAKMEFDFKFRVLLLTNASQDDEPSRVTQWYCRLALQWSLDRMKKRAKLCGLSWQELTSYMLIGKLEKREIVNGLSQSTIIKVHSNLLIVDGELAIRSSSNLTDRSLSQRPCDTELGILFSGKNCVQNFQQKLFRMYMGDDPCNQGHIYSLDDIFIAVNRVEMVIGQHNNSPLIDIPLVIRRVQRLEWHTALTWVMMAIFIYGSGGATGGRVAVTYETETKVVP